MSSLPELDGALQGVDGRALALPGDVRARHRFRRILFYALVDIRPLCVLGFGSMTAAIGGSLWLLGLTLAGYAGMTLRRAFHPEFGRRVLARTNERLALPSRDELLDADLRVIADATAGARDRIAAVVTYMRKGASAELASLFAAVDRLEQAAIAAIRHLNELVGAQRCVDRAKLDEDHDRLRLQAIEANDPATRHDYEEAAASLAADRTAFDEIVTHKGRVTARLWRMAAVLEGIPSRLLRMRLRDSLASRDFAAELEHELRACQAELDLSDEASADPLG
jgi:hypothetical protein